MRKKLGRRGRMDGKVAVRIVDLLLGTNPRGRCFRKGSSSLKGRGEKASYSGKVTDAKFFAFPFTSFSFSSLRLQQFHNLPRFFPLLLLQILPFYSRRQRGLEFSGTAKRIKGQDNLFFFRPSSVSRLEETETCDMQ